MARALDTHSGATSYHLRKLASVGLVEDTGEGDGRSLVWGAVDTEPDDDPIDANDAAVADWLARDYLEHFTERATAWLDDQRDWSETWQRTCGLSDHLVLVTEDQMSALSAEIAEVLERYRRLGQGSPGARRVTFYTCPVPLAPSGRPHQER